MQLSGFVQYPPHRRRLIWFLSALDVLTALEGLGALIWLALQPSAPGNRLFLHYSPQRWILLLSILILALAILSLLWVIKHRPAQVNSFLDFFAQPRRVGWLLISITVLFLLAGWAFAWLSRDEALGMYFMRLLPLLVWIMVAVTQAWIFLVICMRQPIARAWVIFFPTEQERRFFPLETGTFLLPVLLGITLLYFILQICAWVHVPEANLFADSEDYLYGAGLELSNPAFFSERRPWGILLIYKLLGRSLTIINSFQVVVSAIAWLWLAWTFIGSVQSRLGKILEFITILGFSLSPTVQVWNHAILSESLSISGTVLILTLFVHLFQHWNWRAFVLLLLIFMVWMSIRESHTYLGLLAAGVLFVFGFLRQTLRVYWLLSFWIGVTFIINTLLASAYGLPRWALPMAEVITMRILPQEEYLEFFSQNGMPTPPELMALSGRWANSDDFAIINNLRLRKFSRWLFRDSQSVYAKFLLLHPAYTIESPLEDIKRLLAADYFAVIPIENYLPTLPMLVSELLYPIKWFWLYLWLSLFVAGFIFAVNLKQRNRIYWFLFTFLLLSIPHLYLVWHGDALDVERHAVLANIQFHLGQLLIFILFIDSIHLNRHIGLKFLYRTF